MEPAFLTLRLNENDIRTAAVHKKLSFYHSYIVLVVSRCSFVLRLLSNCRVQQALVSNALSSLHPAGVRPSRLGRLAYPIAQRRCMKLPFSPEKITLNWHCKSGRICSVHSSRGCAQASLKDAISTKNKPGAVCAILRCIRPCWHPATRWCRAHSLRFAESPGVSYTGTETRRKCEYIAAACAKTMLNFFLHLYCAFCNRTSL